MASFHQMPDRTGLGVAPEQVVAIIESLNTPNISVPGAGTSPTKAYIVGIRLPDNSFTAMLYMHLLDLGTAAIFAPDPQVTTLEGYPNLEGEAITYVESMGFMLDNLNFRARPMAEQQQMTQTLPIFFERPPPAQAAAGFGLPRTPSGPMPRPPSGGHAAPMGGAAPAGANLSQAEAEALGRLLASF